MQAGWDGAFVIPAIPVSAARDQLPAKAAWVGGGRGFVGHESVRGFPGKPPFVLGLFAQVGVGYAGRRLPSSDSTLTSIRAAGS